MKRLLVYISLFFIAIQIWCMEDKKNLLPKKTSIICVGDELFLSKQVILTQQDIPESCVNPNTNQPFIGYLLIPIKPPEPHPNHRAADEELTKSPQEEIYNPDLFLDKNGLESYYKKK